jgi:hypothetical protein
MCTVVRSVSAALVATMLVPLLGVSPLEIAALPASTFAAPWAIIAHGPRLPRPITLADWPENQRLFLAMPGPGTPTDSRAMRNRPYVELALFWGPEWEHLKGSRDAVARLRPEQANQRAWLFLADGERPAVVVLNPPTVPSLSATLAVRVVESDGLAVLRQHGVPVRTTP